MKLDRKGIRNVGLFWVVVLALVLGFVANARLMAVFVTVDVAVGLIFMVSYVIYDVTRD